MSVVRPTNSQERCSALKYSMLYGRSPGINTRVLNVGGFLSWNLDKETGTWSFSTKKEKTNLVCNVQLDLGVEKYEKEFYPDSLMCEFWRRLEEQGWERPRHCITQARAPSTGNLFWNPQVVIDSSKCLFRGGESTHDLNFQDQHHLSA